jgi:RNA polymerase sigma-70 factor, ECF subfamily
MLRAAPYPTPTAGVSSARVEAAAAVPRSGSRDKWQEPPGELTVPEPSELPDTPTLYAAHAGFVWRCLVRLGIHPSDREDLLQEVFVVVHRKRTQYQGRGQVTSWLYAIALRVASHHRRRARSRNLATAEDASEEPQAATPETTAIARQRAQLLDQILGTLGMKLRVVFVMFEVEGLPCDQISGELGIPIGTVYSRLHAAREQVKLTWREIEPARAEGKRQ